MTIPDNVAVYAADVGKPKNLSWARRAVDRRSVGHGAEALAQSMATDANDGLSIAVGFESPLFLPIAENPNELLKSRRGEGRRPWSAGAGPAATSSGVVAMIWVFRAFAKLLQQQPSMHTEWNSFVQGNNTGHRLFVWEAFVSERRQAAIDVLGELPPGGRKWVLKGDYHLYFDKADALAAVDAFVNRVTEATDVKAPPGATIVSLVHVVAAWLSWSTGNVPLHLAPLVRKEHKPDWDTVAELLESAGDTMPVAIEACFTAR